jgi:hypothetical protein
LAESASPSGEWIAVTIGAFPYVLPGMEHQQDLFLQDGSEMKFPAAWDFALN